MSRYAKLTEILDWGILLTVVCLMAIGLLCVYSSTTAVGSAILARQMLWICIGMVFLAIAFLVDYRTLMYSAWPFYGLGGDNAGACIRDRQGDFRRQALDCSWGRCACSRPRSPRSL